MRFAACVWHMFAAVLGIGAGAAHADDGGPAPSQRRHSLCQHRNKGVRLNAKLDMGERALICLREHYGQEIADKYVRNVCEKHAENTSAAGSQPTGAADQGGAGPRPRGRVAMLPRGYWKTFFREELKLVVTEAKRVECQRALVEHILRSATGAVTRAGQRQGRRGNTQRNSGAADNSLKAPGLHFMLLQFFVDHVQNLLCRADSTLLMTKAREMKDELITSGTLAPSQLPKLEGNPGASWFGRWRRRYGIVYKKTGMKLKVSWRKVLRRVRVELENVFRLRALWRKCHPNKVLKWLSLDQKPSWFNNAGASDTGTYTTHRGRNAPTVRENFAASRERYTILTSVCSWWRSLDPPPPCS